MEKLILVMRGTKHSKNEIVAVFTEYEYRRAEQFIQNQGIFKSLYHLVEFELGV